MVERFAARWPEYQAEKNASFPVGRIGRSDEVAAMAANLPAGQGSRHVEEMTAKVGSLPVSKVEKQVTPQGLEPCSTTVRALTVDQRSRPCCERRRIERGKR